MIDPRLTPDEPLPAPEPVVFTDRVAIDFHEGNAGLHWATMHIGPQAVEIGSVRTATDMDSLLTMAAGVLLERPHYTDDWFVSDDGTQRMVLIGSWILNARLVDNGGHVHYGDQGMARDIFKRIRSGGET